MKLPQELLDEIIGHLPPDDRQSLRNTSLVAKSWAQPSQKHIFGTVEINQMNLRSWLDNISPNNVDLLGHVRHLFYTEYPGGPRGGVKPIHLALRDYLPSFRLLVYLTLAHADTLRHDQIQQFSAFRYTLSNIALAYCDVTESTLIALINYFPGLASLDLRRLSHHKKHEPTPPLLRRSFKKLSVDVWCMGSLGLIDELSKLGMRFEEIVIANFIPQLEWPDFSTHVVNGFGASAKCLRIVGKVAEDGNSSTLSHCQELREFETFTLALIDAEFDLISSIASTKIEKIILTNSPVFKLPAGNTCWRRLDVILVKLAEQSRSELGLEVAFRCIEVKDVLDKQDLKECLPLFVRKGRVAVLDREYKVLYTSDGG